MPYTPPRVKAAKPAGKALEESIAMSERRRKDNEFCDTHYKEFLEKYPDQWVGILNQKLMGAADSPAELARVAYREGSPNKPNSPQTDFHQAPNPCGAGDMIRGFFRAGQDGAGAASLRAHSLDVP